MLTLDKAIRYEQEHKEDIKPEERPLLHLTPLTGWMNDPNGFTCYEGKFHMFYQYYPYDNHWGPMHWGHAVSEDLLTWEYLPAALAPDQPYDQDGCFSGSAITMPDGRQLLIYTAVDRTAKEGMPEVDLQTQAIAIGDGVSYEKIEQNPVIDGSMLPKGASTKDFRDPKIVCFEDGSYRLFCVTNMQDGGGAVLQFRSEDAIHWNYVGILLENRWRLGKMWECPDPFVLDGKYILSASTQEGYGDGVEYPNGYYSFFAIGSYDEENDCMMEEYNRSVDYGPDFYAQQTVEAPDGRRIMMGWMANWDTVNIRTEEKQWYGQMTLPRELFFRDGVLCQLPIRELENYHGEKTEYHQVIVHEEEQILPGISGRMLDLSLEISSKKEESYESFEIRFAKDDRFYTSLLYDRKQQKLTLDRSFSGTRHAAMHTCSASVPEKDGKVKLRLILDRFSVEVFIQDGERAMTMLLPTNQSAEQISFAAKGAVFMNVIGYPLTK